MTARLFSCGVLLVMLMLPVSAQTSMFAYIDERGVVHYTNVPADGRYRATKEVAGAGGAPEDQLVRTIRGGRLNSRIDLRDNTARFGSSPQNLNKYIHVAARTHNVDPLLIKAIIKTESNFDPKAVSSKGAQGLMQLMPGTARHLQVADPFDPLQNINGGTRYFRNLLDSYNGDVKLSLAAYNAGPGNVTPDGAIPAFPETRNYITKVLENYRSYRSGGVSLSSINVRQMVTVN